MNPERPTILIVDDAPAIIMQLHSLLCDDYRLQAATNGVRALQLARGSHPPDLILLDVVMPDLDGYEVCRRLQAQATTREIPVLFLTSRTELGDEVEGFEAGGVDYIAKPINPPLLHARVRTHLALRHARQNLEEKVLERTRDLALTQEATLVALGSLAETRDNETGNHIRRTQRYVRLLAEKVGLDSGTVESIYQSAPLHDIGKVGIPDRILLKPGKLTPEEFEVMKQHPRLGRDALLAAEHCLEGRSDFLARAVEIAYSHHEKWDGSGYPEGLAGEDIPLSARLMAVADVYDALISKRVYKAAMPHEKAVDIIAQGRGNHFDPHIVDAFLDLAEDFRTLALRFADAGEEIERKARLQDVCDFQTA